MIPLRDDNPTSITPAITVGLIAINVVVFLYQLSLGPQGERLLVYQYGSIPSVIFGAQKIYQYGSIPSVIFGAQKLPTDVQVIPPTLSLFTSMFLHGGFMHLIGNMLYLWIFGNNIEDAMGHVRYVAFYLVTGLAASLAHAFTNPGSIVPAIGASGAISGVLGAYLLLYPRAQVLVLIPIIGFFSRLMYIPAGFALGIWFLFQLVSGGLSAGQPGGGVAWFAHIGGFLAGMLLVGVFKRRSVRFFNPPHHHSGRIENW